MQEVNLNSKQYVSTTYHLKALRGAYRGSEHDKQDKETTMPVQRLTINGETFYRWGTKGKVYKTKAEAERQGQAAYAAGYGKKKKGYGK